MRSIEQIVHDNGGDNTPALDTHNLTGRAAPEGVEHEWVPFADDEPLEFYGDVYENTYETWLGSLDCE